MRDYKVTGVQTCVFFFQAEDGIRDYKVTGVQTWLFRSRGRRAPDRAPGARAAAAAARALRPGPRQRWRRLLPRAVRQAQLQPPRARAGKARGSRPAARDRKSVVEGKRGDLGGRRIIKKK